MMVAILSLFILLRIAAALNGNGRQAFTTYDGWKAFEIVTQGDKLGAFKMPGNFDGIGAYLMDGGYDIRILVNHESPYSCDMNNDASVSEVIISKASFISAIKNALTSGTTNNIQFVTSMGLAYDSFRLKDGTIAKKEDFGAFKWFCSGHVHKAHTFGYKRGFVDQIYIFGEEAPAPTHGRIFALQDRTLHLISGSGTGNAAELQGGINGLPGDALENVAMIDTKEGDHVIFVCSPDYGTQALRLYVGIKGFRTNGESCGECTDNQDYLARNGLAFGSTFYMQGSLPTKGGLFEFGSFGTSLNDAVRANKLEDVATSPLEPNKVVLAEQLSGVYIIDFDIKIVDGIFSAATSSFSITKLDLKPSNPDNVEFAADGSIYVASDDSTGSITRMTPDGNVFRIAASNGEATGIVDISHVLDLNPSSVLLVNSMSCPTSMSVLLNPDTVLPTTPPPTGKPSPPTKTPTNAPTKRCGNGFCEIDESSTSCSFDCANRELSLLTDSSRGSPGIVFWVTADSRDLDISGFKFYTWAVTNSNAFIYTRSGTYTGHEQNEDGWELVFEDTVQLNGDNGSYTELNLANKVGVPSGSTRSFFIWLDSGNMKYEAGLSEGDLLGSDDFIRFFTGAGITAKFAESPNDVYSPRRFSGIISYDVLSSVSTSPPTARPVTPSPTKRPITSSPTESPSAKPVTSSPTKRPITFTPTSRSPSKRPSTSSPTKSPSPKPTQQPVTSSPTNPPTKSPTPQPSSTCGSGTCELHESSSTCPADCSNIIWAAHDFGNSGANGIMFNMMAKRDVIINSLDVYTDDVRSGLIEVFTRSGGYNGHELDAAGWSAIYTKTVYQNGRTVPTSLGRFDAPVSIRAGTVQAFYIYSPNIIMYDAGNVDGGAFGSDASLTIYQGAGIASTKFPSNGATSDVVYSPRVFKGNVHYDAVTLPTLSPSSKPITSSPTKRPTNSPSKRPSTSSPTKRPSTKPVTPRPTKRPTKRKVN